MHHFGVKSALKTLQAVGFLLFSANISAHGLHLFAQFDGQQIVGKAYYSDQTPAVETYVEAYQGQLIEPAVSGNTDQQGRFSLPISGEPPFKVVVEGMEGHRAEQIISVQEKIGANTSANSASEFQQLRADIDQLKKRLFWRDIIGGIGYIVGIFGLIALFKAKKGTK